MRKSDEEIVGTDLDKEVVDDVCSVEEQVDDKTISVLSEEVAARNRLVQAYRATKVKSIRKQRTTRSVRMLHKKFSYFVKLGWC